MGTGFPKPYRPIPMETVTSTKTSHCAPQTRRTTARGHHGQLQAGRNISGSRKSPGGETLGDFGLTGRKR